ncbi:hypothetical protein GPJ56_000359 [Histomonas meleagridis]|nr:hypothetical protein GPJ56_000359 [Histomonas meleagridis]
MAENETERLYEPELLRSETEIVLGEETENVDEEKTSDVKITKKAVKDLTQEEKEIIIANAKKAKPKFRQNAKNKVYNGPVQRGWRARVQYL